MIPQAKTGKPVTAELRETVYRMTDQGCATYEIAKTTGRHISTIARVLDRRPPKLEACSVCSRMGTDEHRTQYLNNKPFCIKHRALAELDAQRAGAQE